MFVLSISGLHKHSVCFIGGYTLGPLGHFFYEYRMNSFAQRDAVFHHYVELHPEDFPPLSNASVQMNSVSINVFFLFNVHKKCSMYDGIMSMIFDWLEIVNETTKSLSQLEQLSRVLRHKKLLSQLYANRFPFCLISTISNRKFSIL